MKFSVSSSDLLSKLSLEIGAISSNPVLPILEDFLFKAEGDSLTIAATNLETTIITSLPVNVEEEGQIAIPAKILLDTLKALPDQPINFIIDDESRAIEITSAFGKYKLSGDNATDFPEIPSEDGVDSISMSATSLQEAITKTIFATSNDELRQAMMGVYVQVDYNNVIFVATDAHKLVKYSFGDVSSNVTQTFIIPKKGLTLLRNAISSDVNVDIAFNQTNAFFSFDDTKVIIRLIDAKYPDYNAVIPVNNPHLLTMGRKDLQNSLKRIAIYANKTTNQVVLSLDQGSLTISAQDLDFSNEATEQLTCTYEGEPMTIGFNAKFLIEMLGIMDTNDILLELSTPNRAGVLLPAEQNDNETLLMLVMPVMMSN
jgi:DNA polymerase-3 subunit beta